MNTLSSLADQLPTHVDKEGNFTLSADESWGQGRTIFGGIIAAAGIRALTLFTQDKAPPRTVTTTFEKPIAPGLVQGQCSLLYSGKRVTNAQALFSQEGEVKTRVNIIFGASRPSTIAVQSPLSPPSKKSESLEPIPYFEGIAPAFTQHVDYRWGEGDFPFTGSKSADFAGFCQWKNPGKISAAESIVGLLDAWAAPILAMSDGPIPASSIIWTAHLIDVSAPPDARFWMDTKTLSAGDGYSTTLDQLRDESGKLVAFGEQLVAYFT